MVTRTASQTGEPALAPRVLAVLAQASAATEAIVITAQADDSEAVVAALRQVLGPAAVQIVAITTTGAGASEALAHEAITAASRDSEKPAAHGALFVVAHGAVIHALPPHGLVVAAGPDGLAAEASDPGQSTVIEVPRGPAPNAPTFVMAMAGSPEPAASAELGAIDRASRLELPTEPVAADTGRALYLLARARRARRVLEIGTGAGAAAIWLSAGLRPPAGRLTSIERDSARHAAARRHLSRAGLSGRVELLIGEAARHLPRLVGTFDMVLLDEDATDRCDDLQAVLPLCVPGALIVAHGALADPSAHSRFGAVISVHPEIVATTTLAVGAGLTLAVVSPDHRPSLQQQRRAAGRDQDQGPRRRGDGRGDSRNSRGASRNNRGERRDSRAGRGGRRGSPS